MTCLRRTQMEYCANSARAIACPAYGCRRSIYCSTELRRAVPTCLRNVRGAATGETGGNGRGDTNISQLYAECGAASVANVMMLSPLLPVEQTRLYIFATNVGAAGTGTVEKSSI